MTERNTVPVSKAIVNRASDRFIYITQADADKLRAMGSGNNVSGKTFTKDGQAAHLPSASDHWPDKQTNVVPLQLSMGAFNCLQQTDCHGYWEFNYTTNWIHPLYELPFTGGIPGTSEAGKVGALSSVVPGSGPSGVKNDPAKYGDAPNNKGVLKGAGPRDPDKFDAEAPDQREFRQRFIPRGLANEILLDTYVRIASFEPGVISAEEGDVDSQSDGFADNTRLFLPATVFNRFAVTREIDDGLLAPCFAPSERAWVLSGRCKRFLHYLFPHCAADTASRAAVFCV